MTNKATYSMLHYFVSKYKMSLNEKLIEARVKLAKLHYSQLPGTIYDEIIISLTELVAAIPKNHKNRATFIDNNKVLLQRMQNDFKYALDSKTKKLPCGFRSKLIQMRDQIFKPDLHLNASTQPSRVTTMYNEFLKGITVFQSNVDIRENEPAYHRSRSCPPRGNINLICDAATDPETRRKVELCYIERLIYDAIWLKVMYNIAQDEGHINWLRDTKDAFIKCFPYYSDVKVNVEFQESDTNLLLQQGEVPYALDIEWLDANGSVVKIETYTKFNNLVDVDCRKEEGEFIYEKLSSYSNESSWNQIQSGGKPRSKKKRVVETQKPKKLQTKEDIKDVKKASMTRMRN